MKTTNTKKLNVILLMLLCVGVFASPLRAQTVTSDPRVAKILGEMKLEYQVNKGGDYEVTYGVGKKRTQIAQIVSKAENIYETEVRAVISLAAISEVPFSREITDRLLAQNMETLSHWAVIKVGKNFALFNIKYIPADADAKTVDAAISSVTAFADEMEEQLMKADKF